MECTQKLECTQDLYESEIEKRCPDQIGFLGILGAKHPIVKGPNKIGRDPSTCQIVLNLNSVSRQHAVINVLSSKEYMLMDLDSANKTKLLNKTLLPYIPQPLKNGDTVQFGDIFGIFRLLEDDVDLPMTQALDIPDTPVPSRYVSKLNKAPTTMIPESPEVSDREESFIAPSQPKEILKLTNNQIIKPFGKSISIHPISSPKVNSKDNSKRSNSLVTPNTSLNDSFNALQCDKDSIHEMDTQIPEADISTDSIYNAATQLPTLPNPIHDLDTQVPVNHLPHVQKIKTQPVFPLDVYNNKENDISIFNAETQPFVYDKNDSINKTATNLKPLDDDIFNAETQPFDYDKADISKKVEKSPSGSTKSRMNTSEEELVFDDIDDELIEDLNSQAILHEAIPILEAAAEKPSISPKVDKNQISLPKLDSKIEIAKDSDDTDCEDIDLTQKVLELPKVDPKKRGSRIKSDSSTDCEDIELQPTQKVQELVTKKTSKISPKASKRISRIDSDSSIDCEEIIPPQKVVEKDDDLTDCEDDIIAPNVKKTDATKSNDVLLEDMATQVIELDKEALEDMPTQIIDRVDGVKNDLSFEDQPTQVIDEIVPDLTKNIVIDSPFKVPLLSPRRMKKDTKLPINSLVLNKVADNYYDDTQDIYDDLCSQRPDSPIIGQTSPLKVKKVDLQKNNDDDIVPSSVEEFQVGDRFANIELGTSTSFSDDKVKKYSNLSSSQVPDVIGVSKPKKFPSDSSDVESTPKKLRPFIFTDSDLPSSQEITTSLHPRTSITESSSESEPDNNSEESYTPFLHRKNALKATKRNHVKKLDINKLPERVITRKRKPTAKVIENYENNKISPGILKPKFLTEQEDQIDSDIITENIKRLKTFDKGKSKESKDETYKEEKKVSNTVKSDNKEKLKVKIGRPKRNESARSTRSKNNTSRKGNEDSQDKSIDKLETTSSSVSSTRSTRNRRKAETENALHEISKEVQTKPKRTYKKRSKSKSPIRRSKRQQTVKNKTDTKLTEELQNVEAKAPKSILKKSIHEQSTVYNISSSSQDSPKNMKRSLVDNSEVPSPKRTRSNNNSVNSSVGSINNANPARVIKTQHVLFTAFPSEEVKQKLENLGAVIVSDVVECSVVLTMAVKRTFKLLCAVGLGKPIVGPNWVQACVDNNMIVDPWLHLIKDEAAEKRFKFSLERTLSGKRNFLKGYHVSSTPSVQPNATEMKLIVESSGGIWKEGGSNWVCVSSTKDKTLWPYLRKRGAIVVSTEFILGGVLRQKLEITPNEFK